MKKGILIFLFIWMLSFSDTITGTAGGPGGSPHIAALSPKVCDDNPYDLCFFFCSSPWDFSITPPNETCHFSPDTEYYVSTSVPSGSGSEIYQSPGDPVALVGPFHVDASGNADLGTFTEITSGGFEGTIYNADAKFISIDSIKILIEHHYLGKDLTADTSIDYYGSPTVISLESLTPLGGGNYHYAITDFPSGGKRVTFFDDANNNNTLDAGELATTIDRDVGIVGEQYDDSVDIDLSTLKVNTRGTIKPEIYITATPNPFNSSLKIWVSTFAQGENIIIRDLLGRVIAKYPAKHSIVWNGMDKNGVQMPSGVYFVSLSKHPITIKKVWLIR